MQNYSVLMSVYHKEFMADVVEKPEYLRQAIESIQAQTLSTNDFVLVCDGRQSFRPGEITAEEANKVGYELAMRFTKGHNVCYCTMYRPKRPLLF